MSTSRGPTEGLSTSRKKVFPLPEGVDRSLPKSPSGRLHRQKICALGSSAAESVMAQATRLVLAGLVPSPRHPFGRQLQGRPGVREEPQAASRQDFRRPGNQAAVACSKRVLGVPVSKLFFQVGLSWGEKRGLYRENEVSLCCWGGVPIG